MAEQLHKSFNAQDRSYFAILKKEIHAMAAGNGFDEHKTGEVDIIVAEMTSNLLKHGGGGEILVKVQEEGANKYIEIISIDNGKGMGHAEKMVGDGISTTATMGHGLGSIKRQSDVFDIYSQIGWGTIVLSRVYNAAPARPARKRVAETRCILLAKPGEEVSGDGASRKMNTDYMQLMLGDGLGHGPDAYASVCKGIEAFEQSTETDPEPILREMHLKAKRTRGMVGTVAIYSFKEKIWRLCGIGNISTSMISGTSSKHYMAYNGILGVNVPGTIKSQTVLPEHAQILVMCSDGMKTRHDAHQYPGILKHDLSILAAAIYKDFGRKTDDMSVMVCRVN